MTRKIRCSWMIAAPLVVLTMVLIAAGCSSAPATGIGNCLNGVCVKLDMQDAVTMGEAVPITITVETEHTEKQLTVGLGFNDPHVVVEGEQKWVVDMEAGQSQQFLTVVRFPSEEGRYLLVAETMTFPGGVNSYVRSVDLGNPWVVQNAAPYPSPGGNAAPAARMSPAADEASTPDTTAP